MRGTEKRAEGHDEPTHWVHIEEGERHLGAGFLITRGFVLTALHCLRGLSSLDARVDLRLPDRRRVSGRVCDSVEEMDLALIAVENAHAHQLPPAPPTDWPRPQVRWRGRYRPPNDNPQLSGTVTHAPVSHRSAAGGEFAAVQLTVDQLLGDFSGYSGSPVAAEPRRMGEPEPPEQEPWRVVGILMEQELSRDADAAGTNVLYAASVRHAMEFFPYFDVAHLADVAAGKPIVLPGPRQHPVDAADVTEEGRGRRSPTADADAFLKSLRQWEESGYISAEEAAEHRGRALRKLGDRLLGGPGDE